MGNYRVEDGLIGGDKHDGEWHESPQPIVVSAEPTNAEREPSDVHGVTGAGCKAFGNHSCDANSSKVTNSNVRFQQIQVPWSKSTRSRRKKFSPTPAPLPAVRYLCDATVMLRETST